MPVILCGWQPQKREMHMICNLQLQHRDFKIYNWWHIQWRNPYLLSGWMKNPTYYSATAGIQTSNLPHSMTLTRGK